MSFADASTIAPCRAPRRGVMPMPAPETKQNAQAQREVAEVLHVLARMRGWLAKEHLSTGVAWKLFVASGEGGRCLRNVATEVVRQLRAWRLVECSAGDEAGRLRISRRGLWWLQGRGLVAGIPPQEKEQTSDLAASGKRGGKRGGNRGGKCLQPPSDKRRQTQRLLVRDAETGHLREVEVNLKENPLLWLARRKDAAGCPLLEPHHVAAGERLRQQFETACMQPKVTASWNPALTASDRGRLKSGPKDPYPFVEHVIEAREKVHAALQAIGDDLADIIVAVCCLGHGLETAERTLQWPRRSARLVLRIALERLAHHYGIAPTQGVRRNDWRKALSWHAEGGKPVQLMPDAEENDDDRQRHAAPCGKS